MKGGGGKEKENPKNAGAGASSSGPQHKSRSSRWDKEQPKDRKLASDPAAAEVAKVDPKSASASGGPKDSNLRPLDRSEPGPSQIRSADVGFPKNAFPEPQQWRQPPPVPQIGFEIFEKRSITLSDGTPRTYYALPSDPQSFPGNITPSSAPAPVFDTANFVSRDSNPGPYGQENNQFSRAEKPIERFYAGPAQAGPPGGEGSILRDQYFSPEGGRDRVSFPRPEGSAREEPPYRNPGPAGSDEREYIRLRRPDAEAEEYYHREHERAKFASMENEGMRQMRLFEVEAEEYYQREQERAKFPRLEDEGLSQKRLGMSRPSQYENPHGASASGVVPPERDFERWISPSRMGAGGLRRKAEEDHDYQRPSKFQRQGEGYEGRQQRTSTERRQQRTSTERQSHDKDGGLVQRGGLPEENEELKQQIQKAFLKFSKVVNENPDQCKKYQENGKAGQVRCAVCGWQSRNFVDTHNLVMHAYDAENPTLRTEHLGLHKALCVLMGWSYALPPDNGKSYQSLTLPEATANKEDLILWPPMVIVHNAFSGKKKDGIGNREMDEQLKELGFTGGKAKALYGKGGHYKGLVVVKFSPTTFGLREAERLFKYFEVNKHGRKDWLRVQASTTDQENDDKNPDFIQIDEKTKLEKRVLYGYIAIAGDLEKLDFDMKKKAVVKSRREIDATADDVIRVA